MADIVTKQKPTELKSIAVLAGMLIGLDMDGITLWQYVQGKGWFIFEQL
jgi:hypothetical protein